MTIFETARVQDPEAFTLTIRPDDLGGQIANQHAAINKAVRAEVRNGAIPIALDRVSGESLLPSEMNGSFRECGYAAFAEVNRQVRAVPAAQVDPPQPNAAARFAHRRNSCRRQ